MKTKTNYFFKPSITVCIITILFLSLVGWAVTKTINGHTISFTIISGITLFIIGIAPLYTTISEDCIILHRLIGRKKFNIKEDYTLRKITVKELDNSNAIRAFGSGGFMGVLGIFYSKKFGGFFYVYIVNDREMALLENKKTKKIYIINYPSDLLA